MKRFISLLCLLILFLPASLLAQTQFKALVLACPSKYHFEFVSVAKESFRELADLHHFELQYESFPYVLEGDLDAYDVIVFLNTDPASLNPAQRAGLERFVKSGKGFVAVHRSIVVDGDWDWYRDLVGRTFTIHPIIQSAIVQVEDADHPSTLTLPKHFLWSDEWYETQAYDESPLHLLLSVDEDSYDPTWIWPGQESHGMGELHPVSWTQEFEGSRVFVSALGHLGASYRNERFLEHLYGGIFWAAKGRERSP